MQPSNDVGASLTKPHTSRKLIIVVMYTNSYKEMQTISLFGCFDLDVAKVNTQFTDYSYLIVVVIYVA